MALFRDEELVPLVSGPESDRVILSVRQLEGENWYSKDSPVQPSSVDLRIGNIYLPQTKEEDMGGAGNPIIDQYVLPAGHTAIITTLEHLRLPSDIAGITFPPSHVSFQGILITNPGHVDPGYHGPMRFTVINMGKQNYVLRKEDPIATLLLIKLEQNVRSDWLVRAENTPGGEPDQQQINKLAPDFVDVENRASRIASTKVRDAEIAIKTQQLWAPIITALVTLAAATIGGYFSVIRPAQEDINALKADIRVIEEQRNFETLERRINKIEKSIYHDAK